MAMGVFSDNGLRKLKKKGVIYSKIPLKKNQIQASSLDLRLKSSGYCLPCSSLPFSGDLEKSLKSIAHYKVDLRKTRFLHKRSTYIFELEEKLNLPENLAARSNPKSSTGRDDVHTRLVTENGKCFDDVIPGYQGKLWLEIFPYSFDALINPGELLNQLRIFDKNSEPINTKELECYHAEEGLLFRKGVKLSEEESQDLLGIRKIDLRLDLSAKVLGYRAKPNAPPIDFSKRDLIVSEYFDKIVFQKKHNGIIIDNGDFCILSSLERVRIPYELCAEMMDITTELGEFRVHYAGFFDPGFNATATLEFRNLGAPFLLRHEQKIASLKFLRLKTLPTQVYGLGSHYQRQKGVRLSKRFKN